MLGHPKFKREERVKFSFPEENKTVNLEGDIYIVDAYGTFFQTEEPSYDIMVEKSHRDGEPCLYKHIPESLVSPV